MPRRGGGSSAGARGGRTAALAAPPAEVAAYLSERAERSKLATVRSAAAAIAAACRATGRADPTKMPLVADTLRGIGSAGASGAPRPRRSSGPTFERDEQLRVRVRTSAGAR